MRRSMSGAVVLVALWSLHHARAGDTLKPTHGGSREKGAIVDGVADGVTVNDRGYTELQGGAFLSALFPVIPLDNFTPSSATNEAIAFAGRHPPVLVPITWTAGSDAVTFAFEDEYHIPVQVWIVQGPFDVVRNLAVDASVETSGIWAGERQGLAFESFDVVDATGDPDAPAVVEFACAVDVKTLIGFVPGRVNVYYVHTVNFGNGAATTNGVFCGGGVIGMGDNTSGHLLAHELGHAFYLFHTNTLPAWFDTQNVMDPASSDRRYLTEGQTFRAVFTSFSALNSTYDVRPGMPTRDCDPLAASDTTNGLCPPVQKRVWADGPVWPPN